MRKNKLWHLAVAASITQIICQPRPGTHILQRIRAPYNYCGLDFTDDKQAAGQVGNRVQGKPGPLGRRKSAQHVPMKGQ